MFNAQVLEIYIMLYNSQLHQLHHCQIHVNYFHDSNNISILNLLTSIIISYYFIFIDIAVFNPLIFELQIAENDRLPKCLCYRCMYNLENFYDFRTACVNAVALLERCLPPSESVK